MFDNFVFTNEKLSAETMDFDLISWTLPSSASANSYMDNISAATSYELQQVMKVYKL